MQYATWTTSKTASWWKALNEPVTGRFHRAQIVKRLDLMARLLDDAFQLPGTKFRLGWDGIVGFLLPGVGDTATTLLSAYIVWEAKRLGVPKRVLAEMIANLGVDFVIGAIPAVGDLFDVVWKANRRNVNLLLRSLHEHGDVIVTSAASPGRSAGRSIQIH